MNQIKYYHIRYLDYLKNVYNINILLNSSSYNTPFGAPFGGITFAFEKRPDGWYVAHSKCCDTDQFNRKLGREISKGRLQCKRKNLAYFVGTEEPTYEDCLIFYNLLINENSPV